jgi:hypothetical protein
MLTSLLDRDRDGSVMDDLGAMLGKAREVEGVSSS